MVTYTLRTLLYFFSLEAYEYRNLQKTNTDTRAQAHTQQQPIEYKLVCFYCNNVFNILGKLTSGVSNSRKTRNRICFPNSYTVSGLVDMNLGSCDGSVSWNYSGYWQTEEEWIERLLYIFPWPKISFSGNVYCQRYIKDSMNSDYFRELLQFREKCSSLRSVIDRTQFNKWFILPAVLWNWAGVVGLIDHRFN